MQEPRGVTDRVLQKEASLWASLPVFTHPIAGRGLVSCYILDPHITESRPTLHTHIPPSECIAGVERYTDPVPLPSGLQVLVLLLFVTHPLLYTHPIPQEEFIVGTGRALGRSGLCSTPHCTRSERSGTEATAAGVSGACDAGYLPCQVLVSPWEAPELGQALCSNLDVGRTPVTSRTELAPVHIQVQPTIAALCTCSLDKEQGEAYLNEYHSRYCSEACHVYMHTHAKPMQANMDTYEKDGAGKNRALERKVENLQEQLNRVMVDVAKLEKDAKDDSDEQIRRLDLSDYILFIATDKKNTIQRFCGRFEEWYLSLQKDSWDGTPFEAEYSKVTLSFVEWDLGNLMTNLLQKYLYNKNVAWYRTVGFDYKSLRGKSSVQWTLNPAKKLRDTLRSGSTNHMVQKYNDKEIHHMQLTVNTPPCVKGEEVKEIIRTLLSNAGSSTIDCKESNDKDNHLFVVNVFRIVTQASCMGCKLPISQ